MTCAGLHRTAPGVTEQLVDCSGGDVRDEETGFARKADALTRVMANEVREAPLDTESVPSIAAADGLSTSACTRVGGPGFIAKSYLSIPPAVSHSRLCLM